jgi:putative transposase
MLQPLRRRTWAPSGQTPVQRAFDRHDRVSVMATLTMSPVLRQLGYFFAVWQHNITTEQAIWFLTEMHRYFRRKIIIIWDGSSVHRSAARHFQTHHPEWFLFEPLPAYAPDLNPVEASWSHSKYGELANFLTDDVDHLQAAVETSLENKQHRPDLLRSFFQASELSLE